MVPERTMCVTVAMSVATGLANEFSRGGPCHPWPPLGYATASTNDAHSVIITCPKKDRSGVESGVK